MWHLSIISPPLMILDFKIFKHLVYNKFRKPINGEADWWVFVRIGGVYTHFSKNHHAGPKGRHKINSETIKI